VWTQRVDAFERVSQRVMMLVGRDLTSVVAMPITIRHAR
jgi:hypothetical protein